MENIITNTRTMMGDRRDGCDGADSDVEGGDERKRKRIGGSYIRVTEDSDAGAVIHTVGQTSTPFDDVNTIHSLVL